MPATLDGVCALLREDLYTAALRVALVETLMKCIKLFVNSFFEKLNFRDYNLDVM